VRLLNSGFLLGKTAGKKVVMLETAYKEAALGKTQVYDWFYRFRNGELSVADQPRSRRPSTYRTDENIARIRELILEDRQNSFLTVKLLTRRCMYLQVLKRLREVARRKRPELWQSGAWWLHHDNAPGHNALSVKQFLTKNSMTQLLHPPYSPDLALCDFFLFPRMKQVLKGKRFVDVEEAKKKTKEALKGIILQEIQDCFEKRKTRLDRHIA
jgi:transposase